ncbi:MAG TPA: polysaccharide deacetylase family protein [Nitrospiraceae bacterium]|jgi:peptidoglycan/xylan/chitin deacetylase (PgdA/CDA1 family)
MSLIILNFHGVGPITRNIDDSEHDCWLDQSSFEEMLDMVRDHSHVRLTVDDGNASDVEIVLPTLLKRGLSATFFICSGRLDQPTFLSLAQVQELRAQGMGIGSHGVAHVPWRKLSADRLFDELEGSRQVLEKVCGAPVDTAACPFGAYDRTVLNGLRRAGYRRVFTSDDGAAIEKHWLQSRTTVTRSMPLAQIQQLIQHGPGLCQQWSINARKYVKRLLY